MTVSQGSHVKKKKNQYDIPVLGVQLVPTLSYGFLREHLGLPHQDFSSILAISHSPPATSRGKERERERERVSLGEGNHEKSKVSRYIGLDNNNSMLVSLVMDTKAPWLLIPRRIRTNSTQNISR